MAIPSTREYLKDKYVNGMIVVAAQHKRWFPTGFSALQCITGSCKSRNVQAVDKCEVKATAGNKIVRDRKE